MRKIYLYTQDELAEIAKRTVREESNDGQLKHWEVEISNTDWPKLHVYFFNVTDGQRLRLVVIPLEGPK